MREAVISLSDAELASLGIDGLVSLCRSAGLRDFEEVACYGDGAVVQVTVETRLADDRLDALEYVTEWELVSASDNRYLYLIAFTTPALSARIAEHAEDLIGTCDPVVSERGATMSLVGPQEAIRNTIGEYETAGTTPDLQKLGVYEGPSEPLDDLTERQREVIRTAYDMGYYEVPREVSTSDVAASLDLDPSTVSEHLQRAERNLLSYHLSKK